jgi:hypothetical protein
VAADSLVDKNDDDDDDDGGIVGCTSDLGSVAGASKYWTGYSDEVEVEVERDTMVVRCIALDMKRNGRRKKKGDHHHYQHPTRKFEI